MTTRTISLPQRILALTTALAMIALAALHVYWIAGGEWGLAAATPVVDGKPMLEVTARLPYFALILLLLMGAYVMLCQAGVLAKALLPGFYRAASWGVALLFMSRALGDLNTVGIFKHVTDTRFAWYDTRVVVPLCLALAVTSAVVEILDHRGRLRAERRHDGPGEAHGKP